ncbi:MAG: Stp1/IreP family PP2C-type Ser/Thr phosphatase [Bacillota bacterium]
MEFGVISDIGKIRDINEDAFYVSDKINLFMVADGMGGHNAGEVASNIAINTISTYIEEKIQNQKNTTTESVHAILKKAVLDANKQIYAKANEDVDCQGMGTTLTLGLLLQKLYIGHIGDSRAYVLKDNCISQITQDHSLVAELVKNGSITEDEAKVHPQRNIITRALGTEKEISVDIQHFDLESGAILVLCTDGLSNLIHEKEILECFSHCSNMQAGCEHLVSLANERGGHDNITIIAIKI